MIVEARAELDRDDPDVVRMDRRHLFPVGRAVARVGELREHQHRDDDDEDHGERCGRDRRAAVGALRQERNHQEAGDAGKRDQGHAASIGPRRADGNGRLAGRRSAFGERRTIVAISKSPYGRGPCLSEKD